MCRSRVGMKAYDRLFHALLVLPDVKQVYMLVLNIRPYNTVTCNTGCVSLSVPFSE